MVTINLVDDLLVTRLEDDSISRYAIGWHAEAKQPTEIDWNVTHDLSVKAHRAIERFTNRRLPIQMKLEKRIPVGGGLGGGSADAAAMLRACNRLFELKLSDDDLRHIAASLGSDVPFLISGGSAIVSGFGNDVEILPEIPRFHAVLFFSDTSCSTGSVYGRFDAQRGGALRQDAVRASVSNGCFFNDLAEAAFEEVPVLRDRMTAIEATAKRPIHVSGSGSTLFLTCDTSLEAGALAAAIQFTHAVSAIQVCPTQPEKQPLKSID